MKFLVAIVTLISAIDAIPVSYDLPAPAQYRAPASYPQAAPSYAPAAPAYAPAAPAYAPAAPAAPAYAPAAPAYAPAAPSYAPAAAPVYAAPVPILQHDANVNEDGSYKFSYKSADYSERQENADNYNAVKGSYSYMSPEGEKIDVHYTADENGYKAYGDSIPTPVPNHYPLEIIVGQPQYSAPKYSQPKAQPQYNKPQAQPQYSLPANPGY